MKARETLIPLNAAHATRHVRNMFALHPYVVHRAFLLIDEYLRPSGHVRLGRSRAGLPSIPSFCSEAVTTR